jgi:diguanylate cyclase (GGDEF)-like protein
VLVLFARCAAAMSGGEATELLRKADQIKTSNYVEFSTIIKTLDDAAQTLSPSQQEYLRYLKGWQSAYAGDYATAISLLKATIAQSQNLTLRFRAGATAANVQALATDYDDAFTHMSQLLMLLPQISDQEAREQGMGVAAYLYNQVGEYDLGLRYADMLVREATTGRSKCSGAQLKVEALYRSGKLKTVGPEFNEALMVCDEAGEHTYENVIRTYIVRLYLEQRRYDDAIKMLQEHHDEVVRARYPRVISEYEALLAETYRAKGDIERARQFAQSAIDNGVKNQYTVPLITAYHLLYEIAQEQGEIRQALAFHEKYSVADKGYLDDVSARQLAFQRVNHDAIASKLQIDALNRQNEVLQLQQQLNKKAAETSRLYITLLLMGLAFILLWAYRTKRSQLHFMKLSRIDGLTGVANRPYFIEQAERSLESGRKTQQGVCIVLCDLDHFKQINDKYGHATGDFVLKQAVDACRSNLRETDIFGRFGGEEFGILLPDCGLEDARQRCEQLRLAISGIAQHPGSMVTNVSASFGIAATGSSGYELRQLLAHADAALYHAKRAGRNLVVTYDAADITEEARQSTAEERVRGVAGA